MNEQLLPPDLRAESQASYYREKFTTEIIPQVEARLTKHAYICGEDFTAADVAMGHCMFWAAGYDLVQNSAVIIQYIKRLKKRPAFQEAFSDAHQLDVKRELQAQPAYSKL